MRRDLFSVGVFIAAIMLGAVSGAAPVSAQYQNYDSWGDEEKADSPVQYHREERREQRRRPKQVQRGQDSRYYPSIGDVHPNTQKKMIQSGTGFFVTQSGYILTNEHVVRGCDAVKIRGAVSPSRAEVIDTDDKIDLALLKTDADPRRIATLRQSKYTIREGDKVMVIGYPMDAGRTGVYKVKISEIIGLTGPQDEPEWLQFSDAALQGNSGGPLLDESGNVLGVIVGKTRRVMRDPETGEEKEISRSDVAISLNKVKNFLNFNHVPFQNAFSRAFYSIEQVENFAKGYVVNIHCLPGEEPM